jgi:hypothetical protein
MADGDDEGRRPSPGSHTTIDIDDIMCEFFCRRRMSSSPLPTQQPQPDYLPELDDDPLMGLPQCPPPPLVCWSYIEEDDLPPDDPQHPTSTARDDPTRHGKKRSRHHRTNTLPPDDRAETEEVLQSGFIAKAPLPIDQAAKIETDLGAEEGEYFVELMRKKLQCIHCMQVRWIARACNVKNAKYMETQTRLKDFSELMLTAFATQFGPASKVMVDPRTRKHSRRDASRQSSPSEKQK